MHPGSAFVQCADGVGAGAVVRFAICLFHGGTVFIWLMLHRFAAAAGDVR